MHVGLRDPKKRDAYLKALKITPVAKPEDEGDDVKTAVIQTCPVAHCEGRSKPGEFCAEHKTRAVEFAAALGESVAEFGKRGVVGRMGLGTLRVCTSCEPVRLYTIPWRSFDAVPLVSECDRQEKHKARAEKDTCDECGNAVRYPSDHAEGCSRYAPF